MGSSGSRRQQERPTAERVNLQCDDECTEHVGKISGVKENAQKLVLSEEWRKRNKRARMQ